VKFATPSIRRTHLLRMLLLSLLLAACASQADSESKASGNEGTIVVETKITGFYMSATSTNAGPLTFNVKNTDDMPHDFSLSGSGVAYTTSRLQPGETESFMLELAAGTYTYTCTMEGHGMMMKGTFNVNS
jgi:plastocyanin